MLACSSASALSLARSRRCGPACSQRSPRGWSRDRWATVRGAACPQGLLGRGQPSRVGQQPVQRSKILRRAARASTGSGSSDNDPVRSSATWNWSMRSAEPRCPRMARRPGAIAWCLRHPAVSRACSYRAWPLGVLARAQRDGGAPAQGGWAGAPLVGAVAVSVRWEARSAIKELGWLISWAGGPTSAGRCSSRAGQGGLGGCRRRRCGSGR